MANLLVSSGLDRVVTLDAHSRRFESFFRGRLTSLHPASIIAKTAKLADVTAVAAPDLGATERARQVAKLLRVPVIIVGKRRIAPGRVESRLASGTPKGQRVLLVDDMADTGGTLFEAAKVLKKNGATAVMAYVSHAIDLGAVSRDAKKHGLEWIKAAFDHRTGKVAVPYAFFVTSLR
jgi:ribose-phosphate pyrophosphokinase